MTSFSELARILELKTEFDEIMNDYEGMYLAIPCPRYLTPETANFFNKWMVGKINRDDQTKISDISRKFLDIYNNQSKYVSTTNEEDYDNE